jgi:VWFA-related protein
MTAEPRARHRPRPSTLAVVVVSCAVAFIGAVATGASPGSLREPHDASSPQTTPPGRQGQRPIFRGGVDLVTIDAYPRRNGRLVEGLTAADFEVFEDGKPQAIEQFEFVRIGASPGADAVDPSGLAGGLGAASDPRRRLFVVFLDAYHVRALGGQPVHAPVTAILDRTFAPGDLFGFSTQGLPPTALSIGSSPRVIEEALLRQWTTGARDRLEHALDPLEEAVERCYTPPVALPLIARHRMLTTIQHLERMIAFISRVRPARTVVMVIADTWPITWPNADLSDAVARGVPMAPDAPRRGSPIDRMRTPAGEIMCLAEARRLASLDLRPLHRQLIDQAQLHNIGFYTVSPTQLTGPEGRATDGLAELAHNTGGRVVARPADELRAPEWIDADTSAYYLLGYRSTNRSTTGGSRLIRVRVKQSGVSVSARRGYILPTPAAAARTAALNRVDPDPPEGVREALVRLSNVSRTVELITTGVEWRPGEELRVVAEFTPAAAGRGGWSAGADIEVMASGEGGTVTARGTGRVGAGARSALVRVPIDAFVGAWRITVRARAGERVLTNRLVVTAGSGVLLSDPLLFHGAAAVRSVLEPAVDAAFSRTERVRVEWPVLAPIDRREARLLDRRGQLVPVAVRAFEVASEQPVVAAAELSLGPLAPGDYIIEITAGRGAEIERRFVAFRVVR